MFRLFSGVMEGLLSPAGLAVTCVVGGLLIAGVLAGLVWDWVNLFKGGGSDDV